MTPNKLSLMRMGCVSLLWTALDDNKTKQQIFPWHIIKNVVQNIRKEWIGTLDGTIIGDGGGGVGAGFYTLPACSTLEKPLHYYST